MEAKKILCILSKLKGGGTEKIVFSYYSCIDKSRYQFDFVYEEGSTQDIPDELLDMGAGQFVVPDIHRFFKYYFSLKRIIKRGNYSIIHTSNNTLSFLSLFAAKRNGIPVRICHSHSMSSPAEKKRDMIKKLLRPLCSLVANKYCACSELSGKWMFGDQEVNDGGVKILNNGIYVNDFVFNEEYRQQIRDEFKVENKFIVGHIGRFVTVKNHKFIIDSFNLFHKSNADSVLFLVGDGELFNDVRNYAESVGISDYILFTGVRNDAYKFYSAFDLFVLPSLYEGFPVVVTEAAASGLPMILSDKISRECKITDVTKFIPIDSPYVWAEEMSKAVTCNVRRAAMLEGGKYDIHVCARNLENFYAECIEEI